MAADITLADVRQREKEEDEMHSESRKRDKHHLSSKCRQKQGEKDEVATT